MLLNTEQINELFCILDKEIKNPVTELNYTNNFTLLLAVVMSAQAKDISVNIATKKLFEFVKTPLDILNLGEQHLIEHIKSIGLYKTKAQNIILLSKALIDKHNGEVPDNFDALISLAGVGRKTANVVLNCAFGYETIPVDTHVFRVSHRMGLSLGKNVDAVEEDLLQKVPSQFKINAHHLLILHGRYTCKAKAYNCSLCSLNHICTFEQKIYKEIKPNK